MVQMAASITMCKCARQNKINNCLNNVTVNDKRYSRMILEKAQRNLEPVQTTE